MKKTVIAISVVGLFSASAALANTKAGDLAGGLELDSKFNIDATNVSDNKNPAHKQDFGIKLFGSYKGIGLSHKHKSGGTGETNINYTYGFEHVYLKGEFEHVSVKNDPNVQKLGLTVGSHLNGILDVSVRYRKDAALGKNAKGEQSNIDRVDLFVGRQITDNLYLNAKAIGFKENDAKTAAAYKGAGAKDTWTNYEVKATFTGFENVKPYVELERAFVPRMKRTDNNVKVGVVFPF